MRPRPTTIAAKTGRKTLTIESTNPDNLINTQKLQDILHELMQKIHISEIQETHIPQDQNSKLNGYRVIRTAAEKENKSTNRKNGTTHRRRFNTNT